METYYYFNENGEYGYSLPNPNVGALPPDNATTLAPVFEAGYWPVWSKTLKTWGKVEDHRKQMDDRGREMEGTGTAFWLQPPFGDDTWQTPARYMTELGPLPDDAVLTQPEKTQAEKDTERAEAIKHELTALDAKSARGMRAVLAGTATEDDKALLSALEANARPLRAELARMGMGG